jgi:hypothetical protein
MLKKATNYLNLISILILCYLAFLPFKPINTQSYEIIEDTFFLDEALSHVKKLSQETHYTGNQNHQTIKDYLLKELQLLSLKTQEQITQVVRNSRTVKVENIVTRIIGQDPKAPALLIMSHYDSAPYTSKGASDALSGVAVILEGVRSYLLKNKIPKNNIVILFTDAEEIGLLGAKAFVNKHPWAKNIGLVLNFEARGTAGTSSMLMETNHGNKGLLNAFKKANVKYPSSSSLHYSIYKLLPSDMDMTVFREDKDIQGYNFAFIDNHFNYHTELDNFENLSVDSFAHQAYYLLPLLDYLSEIDLNSLKSDEDDVYFHFPFLNTINYPYSWAVFISIINILVFLSLTTLAVKTKKLIPINSLKAGTPLFKSLIATILVVITLMKFIYWLHPQYSEMLQGFPYNGYIYIAFFSFLSLSLLLFFYKDIHQKYNLLEILMVPLLFWLIISLLSALFLTGAHFISLLPILATIVFAIFTLSKNNSSSLILLFLSPAIIVLVPLITQLNVAMGLSVIPFACAILVLFGTLIIPSVIDQNNYKISNWLLLALPLIVFIFAEFNSSTNAKRPLPNSLNYYQDQVSNQAYWLSADNNLDDWTRPYFKEEPLSQEEKQQLLEHRVYRIKQASSTENKQVPVATLLKEKAKTIQSSKFYQILITPNRKINKLVIKSTAEIEVKRMSLDKEFIVNNQEFKKINQGAVLATYYITDETEIKLQIELKTDDKLELDFLEYSADLMSHKEMNIQPRPEQFIAKPYGYSDLIITRQRVTF